MRGAQRGGRSQDIGNTFGSGHRERCRLERGAAPLQSAGFGGFDIAFCINFLVGISLASRLRSD